MPQEEVPKYTNSLNVFDGMNIEEYLYNLKFEEISAKVNEAKRKKFRKLVIGVIVVAAVGAGAYFALNYI